MNVRRLRPRFSVTNVIEIVFPKKQITLKKPLTNALIRYIIQRFHLSGFLHQLIN